MGKNKVSNIKAVKPIPRGVPFLTLVYKFPSILVKTILNNSVKNADEINNTIMISIGLKIII